MEDSNQKTWIVMIKYLEPTEGTSYITAETAEEARTKAEKLFTGRRDFEIVDVAESPISQLEMDLRYAQQERAFMGLENMIGQAPKKEDIN